LDFQVVGCRCDHFKISELKRQFNSAESRRFYSLSAQVDRKRSNVSAIVNGNGDLVRNLTGASRHSRRTFWRRRKANTHVDRRNQRHRH
jgi:hypothetical protein